jgi:ABC-2 type transport system ATP-binding protein
MTEVLTTSAPPRVATSPAIETRDLVKRYGALTALAGLTMTVPRGEIFGFLGPNGAGKTTAVKLLLGLTRPTSGVGMILGAPLGNLEARRRVGYLPELFRYQGWLTAREVLEFHCELAGLPVKQRRGEIDDALETVGLATRGNDRVETFSKGMQQRLGLGVALLGRPDLVFLDEPTSALDPVGRHDVREIIRGLKARGTAVFLNSHLLSEVELVCDRVAVVDHGRVIALGAIDELLGQANRVRLRVTGLPPVGESALRRYGELDVAGEWLTIRGISEEGVPDVVAEIVRLGGRIHAVEPFHQTLEDRFLQLLGGAP